MERFILQKVSILLGFFIFLNAHCAELAVQVVDEMHGISGLSDDLHDIELGSEDSLSAHDLMPYMKKNPYLTENERVLHIEQVLTRVQTRGGANVCYIRDLEALVARQKTKSIGLPVVSEDNIKPAMHWLAAKVFKKDAELMGRKIDRQKVITGVTNVGSWVLASGLAALVAYLGTLYN